jgi:DNA-binding transcriptional LysR family regulator
VTESGSMQSQRFVGTVATAGRDSLLVPVPFNPNEVWGSKLRHHIAGTLNGCRIRAVIEAAGDGFGFTVGPKSSCRSELAVGDQVTVDIAPEGPQRSDLADDIAEALAASPRAAAFFDSLAQFYRRGYLRWIDATVRRPEQRPVRIAEMVQLLEAGIKQRP